MCTVEIVRNERTLEITLTVSGHAGAAPKGSDLVCAAVTALTETFIATAAQMAKKGDCKSAEEIADGYASVGCYCDTEEAFSVLSISVATVKVGYDLLATNYPDCVRVKCANVRFT